jgi:undecaprenyl-diphosphatase
MSQLAEILVLAVVQGITEFLPISSSGHLAVLADLFRQIGAEPVEEELTVTIVLHVGTLAAIIAFYWRRIGQLLGKDLRVIGLLVVGTLPAAVVGIGIKTLHFDEALESALLAGLMFPITAAMLLWSARQPRQGGLCRHLSYGQALLIGAFQAFAILPGISRSGATIVAGLACGLRRDEAAAFAFLLAIPSIGGAGLLEALDLASQGPANLSPAALVLGMVVSFAVGLTALWWLLRWLKEGHLHWFAWYLLPLSAAVILWKMLT